MPFTTYKKRDFGLDDIRHMVQTMFVDNLSPPSNSEPIAGRTITMQMARHKCSDVQCNYCKGIGRLLQDCTTLRAKETAPPLGRRNIGIRLITTFNLNGGNTRLARKGKRTERELNAAIFFTVRGTSTIFACRLFLAAIARFPFLGEALVGFFEVERSE